MIDSRFKVVAGVSDLTCPVGGAASGSADQLAGVAGRRPRPLEKILVSRSELQLPRDWLEDSGALNFRPQTTAYSTSDCEATLVEVGRIAPVNMTRRAHLGPLGLDRRRAISILRAIVVGNPLPPIRTIARRGGLYAFTLRAGVHRFHCSIAAGLTHIPTIRGWKFEVAETPE